MNLQINELLLYGGMGLTLCSILFAGVCFAVFKVKKTNLKHQLNSEYGEEE